MLRKSLLVFSILGAAVLIGCGTTETSNSNTAAGNSNKAATSSNTGSSSTTAPATGDKIGIAEFDDYIAQYETCVRGKVPEAARAALENSLKTVRDNWKKLAANEQSRGLLAAQCKQASDNSAASMKAYGCTW
jgi:ABC-type phosphate/phosphonate transport system substrate-binding protein